MTYSLNAIIIINIDTDNTIADATCRSKNCQCIRKSRYFM